MHPHLIDLGPLSLSTYGAFVAAGYLLGILWLKTQLPFMKEIDEGKFWTMIYGLFFGAVAGGKLLFLFVERRAFLSGEMSLVRDFRYGFVFFGGMLGAAAMGFLVRWWIAAPYRPNSDFFGVALPMGHAVGRLGCLFAGCCYGKPTGLPWAVRLGGPGSSTPPQLWGVPLHPVQVYESLSCAAIAWFLWAWALPRAKRGELPAGTVWLGYIFLYSAARFALEFFRGDDRGGAAAGLYPSQWIALLCMAATAALMARWRRESR